MIMKKSILISLLLTVSLCLAACGSASDTASTSPDTSPEKETISATDTTSDEPEAPADDEPAPEIKYLLSRYVMDSVYYSGENKIEYDENGIETHEYGYAPDGTLISDTIVTKVADDGTVLEYETISYDADGNVISKYVNTKSADGLRSESNRYDENGELEVTVINEYDEFGNITRLINRDKDGNETVNDEYHIEYDDQNRVTMNSFGSEYIEDENYTGYSYFVLYEYDGNKEYNTGYSADYTVTATETETIFHYSGTAMPTSWTLIEREYDEHGNKVKETGYSKYSEDGDWELVSTTTYEYIPFEVK